MKNKILILMMLLFFAVTSVNAQYYMRTNNRMTYTEQCLDIPDLTDAQKAKITTINDTHKKSIDAMREQFYVAQGDKAVDIKTKMTKEQDEHLKKIAKVLNKTQLQYFNENIVAGPAGNKNYATRPGRGRSDRYVSGRGRNQVVGRRGGRGRW